MTQLTASRAPSPRPRKQRMIHVKHPGRRAMAYEGYKLLKITNEDRVVTATIDNPPINLITLALYEELVRISKELEADDDSLVFVLKSANPDFFIAHFDVSALLAMPTDTAPARGGRNEYHAMCERFRT